MADDWQRPGLAEQVGLSESNLRMIIRASEDAGSRMLQVSQRLDSISSRLPMVMQSRAGQVLSGRVERCRQGNNQVRQMFVEGPESLNGRTTTMLRVLLDANARAEQDAAAGETA
ncbi:hypothetical protein [Micromonospora craniellae]|uniref:Uncharacterized protein n=1 Tax=Micromonospora craniellae TaxID=2294034 RepID=A0A372FY65_9ACTN|nr:hypothetical protein [Micromonospora craniellae]RFS45564.1 hypothetical protein D0Q02_15790 [Micromonospora craniellae]